jgi:exocyst complex component 1
MTIDRLISGSDDIDGDEENAQATMTTVEEMIEGYDWASDDIISRKAPRGAADLIEARLLDELTALEKVSVKLFRRF